MYEAFSLAHLPSSASAKVIKRHRQKMVTDSRDRERKNASLSAGRFSCLTRPSAKRYHSRLITLPLTASQINCPFPQTWRSWWGWGCCSRPDSLSPPSIECQVVYWLPVFWLASSWANLTAGRWIVLNDESVCFQKVFSPFCSTWKMDELVEKPTAKWRGCAGGERCQRGARLY